MRINILHLRSFYAIALEGSINQAARRMNVSQSTLSKQLKSFESRHKVTLFTGRTPPLRLTSEGEDLMARAKRIFEEIDLIEQSFDHGDKEREQTVRIGSDTPPLAARLAHDLKAVFGQMAISLRIENARETFDSLRMGQTDMAVVMNPSVQAKFTYLPLSEDHLCAALCASHPLAQKPDFLLEDLRSQTLLLREHSSRTRQALEALLLDAKIIPNDQIELHTRETIREALALNMGIGFFFSLECPPDNRIVYKPIKTDLSVPKVTTYLVYPTERRSHPLMRKASDIVRLWALDPLKDAVNEKKL